MFKGIMISLVIPVHNEEHSIGRVLSSVPAFIDEVIVVDNASTDKTLDVCRNFSVTIIEERRKGYGFAYRAGLLKVNGSIVVTMDGDNTYPLAEVERLLGILFEQGYDFINCCRVSRENIGAMKLRNKIGNVLISGFIRLFFRVNLRDSQSGMWIFRKSILSRIMSFDSGMGFSQEIKLRAWLNPDIRCIEMDIPYKKRDDGKSKFRRLPDSIMVLRNLFILFAEINGVA